METIEEVIEEQTRDFRIGRERFVQTFRDIAENGKTKSIKYEDIKRSLVIIGEIARFCTNPYASLISIRDSYTTSEARRSQGMVSWLQVAYQHRTRGVDGEKMKTVRFTPQEINEFISTIN